MSSLNLSRAGHCHRQDTGFKVRLPKATQLPKKADLPFLHALSPAFLLSPRAMAMIPWGEVNHISHSHRCKPPEMRLWGSGRRAGNTFQQQHSLRLNRFEAAYLPSHHLSQYISSHGLSTHPQMYLGCH